MRRKIGLSLILVSFLLTLTACTTEWVSTAINIINALLPAILSLVGFLMAFSKEVPASVTEMITRGKDQIVSGLNLVKSLLDAYNATPDADKTGVLDKIHTALEVIKTQLTDLLTAVHVKNEAAQHKIAALLDLLISQVESLMAMIPVLKATSTADQAHAYMVEHDIAEPLSGKKFKREFNRILKIPTTDREVNRVALSHLLK